MGGPAAQPLKKCLRLESGLWDPLARLKTSLFDFQLDPARIAQEPCTPRDEARLLCHSVGRNQTWHTRVRELADFLARGDLLVVNDTRVRRARLLGRRQTQGAVEFLLLDADASGHFRAMVKPAKRLKPMECVQLEGCTGRVRAIEREMAAGESGAIWKVEVLRKDGERASLQDLEQWGSLPLPPYIRRSPGDARIVQDESHYQTMFAARLGAVAAPTAGLHFTPRVLDALRQRGVELARVTLHVGPGTFRPVESEEIEGHPMHTEAYELGAECVQAIERCRARGGRVIAIGTTSARVLEHCARPDGSLQVGSSTTQLFLRPGSAFRVVDALFTNFHLPRSTLLMLVSAFAGTERTLALYLEAIEREYRFFSYGDAMLLMDRTRDV